MRGCGRGGGESGVVGVAVTEWVSVGDGCTWVGGWEGWGFEDVS